jgi:hypothetical protein
MYHITQKDVYVMLIYEGYMLTPFQQVKLKLLGMKVAVSGAIGWALGSLVAVPLCVDCVDVCIDCNCVC